MQCLFFFVQANFKVHLFTHTQERPFPCMEEGCGKSFRSNEALRRHLLSHQGKSSVSSPSPSPCISVGSIEQEFAGLIPDAPDIFF